VRRQRPGVVATVISVCLLLTLPALVRAADQPTPTPVAAPSSLFMVMSGTDKSVASGGWINSGHFDARFQVEVSGVPLTPQLEIQPSTTAFSGQPTFTGSPLSSSGSATVPVTGLSNRQKYHWQARVADSSGNTSTWVPLSASSPASDIGIDENPPPRPVISSPTNPHSNRWYNPRVVLVNWSGKDDFSGIAGFTLKLEKTAHVIPPGTITTGTGVKISNLSDGTWFLLLRSVDRAGNWSPTGTFRFQLDRQPARLRWLSPSKVVLNPYVGGQTFKFTTDKDASVGLGLYRVGAGSPTATYSFRSLRAGQVATIAWSGKQRNGKPVPRGYYFFSARAEDRAANFTQVNLGGIYLHPDQGLKIPTGQILYPGGGKIIIVSISREALYAYDGTQLVQQTLVTTGNPALPTPPGSYVVQAKYSPFQFISPWPAGSAYWYPPSWSQWAMLFRDGGYFLHDAPWRSVFGPGSNGPGQPGTNYGGTHGCINIPPGPMSFLWGWTQVGTAVDVVP
jgi:L,D-transpeptidase catalytic domain